MKWRYEDGIEINTDTKKVFSLKAGDHVYINMESSFFVNSLKGLENQRIVVEMSDTYVATLQVEDGFINGFIVIYNIKSKVIEHEYLVNMGNIENAFHTDTHFDIIDLNYMGNRWEGFISEKGTMHGWGILYDENGLKEYEGFMYNSYMDGYGLLYHKMATPKLKYKGMISKNCYYGKGMEYDRNQTEIRKGLYYENHLLDSMGTIHSITDYVSNHIHKLTIHCEAETIKEFDMDFFPYLQSLTIGSESFTLLPSLTIENHNCLQELCIEDKCFGYLFKPFYLSKRIEDGLIIKNCQNLNKIIIGSDSFINAGSFQVSNCSNLCLISIDNYCFRKCIDFKLTNCSNLTQCNIGSLTFDHCQNTLFENLPSLTTMHIAEYGFDGNSAEQPVGSLKMLNLEALRLFQLDGYNFRFVVQLEFKNLPNVQMEGFQNDNIFNQVSSYHCENAPILEKVMEILVVEDYFIC